ncbi:MAG: hypothetical protein WEB03_01955 [Nitriliruptor sp.]|uniref:hypothetical protein n=1 Tax=Nitriliruptor sp. TaxID=2448056 RepID=UPI0034A070CF
MHGSATEGRRKVGRRIGAGLVLLVLASGVGGAATAAAQTDEGQPVEIQASTLYVAPATDSLPPTITNSVPPAAVCVVAPELCPDSTDDIRKGIVSGIKTVQDNAVDAPVQPVPPDTAAVSYFAGAPRYQTAILFDAPPVPDGEDVMLFQLTFPEAQPTYHTGSPAFRRAILAAFETIATRDPAVFAAGMAAALEEDPIDTSTVMAFEACPLLEEFEPGGAPQASDAAAMPTREFDGAEVAAVDCTFGGNGLHDETAGVWTVDLAFTAQAWASGEIENHGVLLRPTGAPNLAFGDGDTTTTAQIALALEGVTATIETAEAFDPDSFDFGDEPGFEDEGGLADAPDFADGGGFDDAPGFDDASVGGVGDLGELDDVAVADDPEIAGGGEGEGGEGGEEVALDAQAAAPARGGPSTPWWVWTVVPLLLGGAWLTGSALLAPLPAGATSTGGAMTRMLERHAASLSGPAQI